MINLSELGLQQPDRQRYQGFSRKGVQKYRDNYFSGAAKDSSEAQPRGIAADDFTVFATTVYLLADSKHKLSAIRENAGPIVHVDIGTGPSYSSFIASLPYADRQIAVDVSPQNVESLSGPIEPYWKSWLKIAEVLYDIRHPNLLAYFDNQHPELYDKLRSLPILKEEERERALAKIYKYAFHIPGNPYTKIDLEEALAKLVPRVGDILDGVDSVQDLEQRANILTKTFVSESIANTKQVVAHVETNSVDVGAPGCLWVNAHISETDGYSGFYTDEEFTVNPQKLVELPASPGFFQALNSRVVVPLPKYDVLWQRLAESRPDRRMVRPEASYGHAVICCGEVPPARRYRSGPELVADMPEVRRLSLEYPSGEEYQIYCVDNEVVNYATHFSRALSRT